MVLKFSLYVKGGNDVQVKSGMIVYSNYGHDKNRFYVILKVEGKYVFIADGKNKTLLKSKKKNLKHISLTKDSLDLSLLDTDKKIRQSLWNYNYGENSATNQGGNPLVKR